MRGSEYLSHCFTNNVFDILGSRAYSCRCANGVRVSDDMQDAAPHHTAVYHAPCSAAARRHLYETKMSEHAAPTGKSSATAIYAPSPYDKQRRYISYGNKRHTVRSTHLKEDIRSTPCPYRARITCRFCLRCNDDARRENPASPHRIIAAPTKWMTPEYPPHRHPSAAPRAVPLNRLHRVRGASGLIPAHGREEWRDAAAVKPNDKEKNLLHECPSRRGACPAGMRIFARRASFFKSAAASCILWSASPARPMSRMPTSGRSSYCMRRYASRIRRFVRLRTGADPNFFPAAKPTLPATRASRRI